MSEQEKQEQQPEAIPDKEVLAPEENLPVKQDDSDIQEDIDLPPDLKRILVSMKRESSFDR